MSDDDIPTQKHDISKPILAISTEDLIFRLRQHVKSRGSPTVPNGAWALMLEAAIQLERAEYQLDTACDRIQDVATRLYSTHDGRVYVAKEYTKENLRAELRKICDNRRN